MKVSELIEYLKLCDQDAFVIYNGHGGFQEINALESIQRFPSLGRRMSWETVKVVELLQGDIPYMQEQGLTVIGQPLLEVFNNRVVHYELNDQERAAAYAEYLEEEAEEEEYLNNYNSIKRDSFGNEI